MLELQSCASLANASALCAMGQEVRGESVNVIAEISAELERERQKNAELMERISVLEAQTQGRDKESLLVGQGSCPSARERSFKKFKRHKIESSDRTEDGNIIKSQMASQTKHDTQHIPPKDASLEGCLVNWMSMDDNQLHFENFKNGDSGVDCDDSDDNDSDEYDDYYEEDDIKIDLKDSEIDRNKKKAQEPKEDLLEGVDEGMHMPCLESSFGDQSEPVLLYVGEQMMDRRKKDCVLPNTQPVYKKKKFNKKGEKENKNITGYKAQAEIFTSRNIGSGSLSLQKKPPKMAFCPKEVKRILESPALLLKNAQSHTIRKIIVFASLGTRHGCEDMYELDFNHFSILRNGEPYVSPDNPGEHVLYDNPGVGRKNFYPNRQNPTLCPVQILEEEKAMRPSDASCPSCLFLCIKYGGRTRNLPQNEYVRQRMGRNKLKSFGPAICRMAMLVHIRSGSFFFKALGITLLFMAGFPDDLVQRETKYQNLDLLQKYYRTDAHAEGEELFLPHALACDTPAGPASQQLRGKTTTTKSKSKKETHSTSKSHNLQTSSIQQSAPLSSAPSSQFGLSSYTSIHTHAMAAFQSTPSQASATLPVSNPVITNSGIDVSYHNQTPYHMFPQQLSNAFMPMMYWPPPNTFPPCPYPASFGYRSFPSTGSYISIHPQPYYGHPCCSPSIPKMVQGTEKNDVASEEADGDSDSSSSSTKPKEALASCN